MFGEYGYMEEGALGKPYNFRLLKRLLPYTIPYRKTVLTSLCLILLLTLFELAVPYLSKIAIDRYILASWYEVDVSGLAEKEIKELTAKYGPLLSKSRNKSLWVISHVDTKKIDPVDLKSFQNRGILNNKKFYRIDPDSLEKIPDLADHHDMALMPDGSTMIPYGYLQGQKKETLLKMRARDIKGVTWVALVLILFIMVSFGLNYAEYYFLEFTGQHIMQDIRLELFSKMQGQAVRFFDRHPVGRLVTRVTNDIENLNEMFKSVLVTVFKDIFLLFGILFVLLWLNWRLALVSFTLIPLIFGVTFLFSSLAREAFRELRATVAKINAFLQERLTGMRITQLFVREKYQMKEFSRINRDNYLAGMKQIRVFAVFMPIMELFSSFALALIIWYGGGKVIQDQLTLGSLVAFIGYIQMFFKPIRDISEKYNIMQSAMASTERIFEFMDLHDVIPEPTKPIIPTDRRGGLVFDNVSFAYEKNKPVLQDISLKIKPGETVALVGATGSGKTTLVNLVERFYDPDRGTIKLDGVDLRDWPKSELRRRLCLVMQDVFIFAGNLGENISLGRGDIEDKAVERAAGIANVRPFIEKLPSGFQQELGESGATLSSGERQLLSFARSLVSNPGLLILDEATSSVDPETERLIQGAISRMAAKRTTLVVAHRLSTIRGADRILVMHQGRIVEQGTHETLLNLGGIYYKLNKLREH